MVNKCEGSTLQEDSHSVKQGFSDGHYSASLVAVDILSCCICWWQLCQIPVVCEFCCRIPIAGGACYRLTPVVGYCPTPVSTPLIPVWMICFCLTRRLGLVVLMARGELFAFARFPFSNKMRSRNHKWCYIYIYIIVRDSPYVIRNILYSHFLHVRSKISNSRQRLIVSLFIE